VSAPEATRHVPAGAPAPNWRAIVKKYETPEPRRALLQILNTFLPLAAVLVIMERSVDGAYWLTLVLAPFAAGFLVRAFIIMHDCAHGSFVRSRWLNDAVGFMAGVITMTPFGQWRRDHALHHASSGDLDRRGHGDVNTLTVSEYLARTPAQRFRYRLLRHPLVLLVGGPIHLLIGQRRRGRSKATGDKQLASVWLTNLGIAVCAGIVIWLVGLHAILLVYLPAYLIAASAGVWLFYVQHQFEGTYWEEHANWSYADAAIHGSSYLKLPKVLQWFTGNIGLHHVHHLSPRIPNYNLQRCHDENPMMQGVTVISLREGVRALRLKLWDEHQRRLVTFAAVARR
jgi:acyl-lipid omega-6 desaturase (Delta-12 desaturase)